LVKFRTPKLLSKGDFVMTQTKTFIGVIGLLSVLAVGGCNSNPPAKVNGLSTHLGVEPSAFVALRTNRFVGPTATEFRRLKPDATEDQVTFQIPQGKDLIITDINWYTHSGTPGKCTSILMMEANPGPVVYFTSLANADGAGEAYTAEHFTSGFRVSVMPVFVLVANPACPSPITQGGVNIQGYLVNQ